MKWMYGLLARLRLARPYRSEQRMDEEIRFHIEMEAQKNQRAGMTPKAARRAAVIAFGGVEGHKEELREGRTFGWIGGLSLDVRLAWRILVKHGWLSVVGGLGIALAVAIGTLFFGVRHAFLESTLPFDKEERIVALEVRGTESDEAERRILHEFELWRQELRTVENLAAWASVARNLIVPNGAVGPVAVVEMTSSGFEAAQVPALLGRTLLADDELPGAPPVAVIGYEIWRTRFGSDPAVVGREVRLGNSVRTVVGVMPEGFRFPVSHDLWVPLRIDDAAPRPRSGREIWVFGRLAPGATIESAQAELATLGQRMVAAYPDTHARLRTRLVPYTKQSVNLVVELGFQAAHTLTLLLLVVVCFNIAVLVHARTAVRQGEIAVRSALGATRQRIVGQLFAEAFVLSLGSAMVGLAISGLIFRWARSFLAAAGDELGLGFWIDLGLTPGAVVYAVVLAVGSALIVGVIPALKVTSVGLRHRLDQTGGAGLRLGRRWTVQIVGQVAIATAVLPVATYSAWNQFRYGFDRPDFPAGDFFTAQVGLETDAIDGEQAGGRESERAARFEDRVLELKRRLEADPRVSAVTYAKHSLGETVPAELVFSDLQRALDEPFSHGIRTNELDVGFLEAFEVPVLEGRAFRQSDLTGGPTAVVVNQAFVEQVLSGRKALGRHFRYTWRWGPDWLAGTNAGADSLRTYEIVGVVSDQLVVGTDPGESEARVYHPVTPGRLRELSLAVRMRGGSAADFGAHLRRVAASVDPTLRVSGELPLDAQLLREQHVYRFIGGAIAAITLSVVLLSAAGIHALMSLTVVRRRREIGIRAALGARPARLLAGIFSRAAGQIALGLVLGIAAAIFINDLVENLTGGHETIFISAAAGLMTSVGLLAALGPARRGLRIEPMEALRAD